MAAPEIADLDPDERDIVRVVRDWVDRSVRPVARDLEHSGTYPGELIDDMKRLGVFGLAVPAEYGGSGGGPARLMPCPGGWRPIAMLGGFQRVLRGPAPLPG